MHLNLFYSKATAKILVCDHVRLSMPTKTTLISISYSGLQCSPNYLKNALQTTCLTLSIKGPLTYAGFLITHLENASVFLLTSYVTGALMLCCILCFFCGTIPFKNRVPWFQYVCIYEPLLWHHLATVGGTGLGHQNEHFTLGPTRKHMQLNFHFSLRISFIYFEGRERQRLRQRWNLRKAPCKELSQEPDAELEPMALRSRPEPKPKAACPSDWGTQESLDCL